jgi:4-hydroxy-3-polyprenylbenzoate decarboxylase
VDHLKRTGQLIVLNEPLDPFLEIPEIQRQVAQAEGPALFFSRAKGCSFPLVSNLYGTLERTRWIFRDSLNALETIFRARTAPGELFKKPKKLFSLFPHIFHVFPKTVSQGAIFENQISKNKLPKIFSWPDDGGAYITLPIVYTEHAFKAGLRHSNLGMYRVQIDGGNYNDNEMGLHYQIHRGIGAHHALALEKGVELPVRIIVGGPPALTLAAIMPLPEDLPEYYLAGILGGQRIPVVKDSENLCIPSEADFVISGSIGKNLKPEGPFGDHLGYYSLKHHFPVLKIKTIHHRKNAIWPFTVVGRPPQEDSIFGKFIHELTGPVIPSLIPGLHDIHAVDAAGVHPLLLAIGSERYTPFEERKYPMECLTQAQALLGLGQISLSKYLFIIAHEDAPQLKASEIRDYFYHFLERVDWSRDLHFTTKTTIDTLDYSSRKINEGSKLILAAVGKKKRELPVKLTQEALLPEGFSKPRALLPGILAIQASANLEKHRLKDFCAFFDLSHPFTSWPLWILVNDSDFVSQSLNNFLWVCFTRSNPADDIDGILSFTENKHWDFRCTLVIDARTKKHHAPEVKSSPEILEKVKKLAQRGGPLHGIL